MATLADILKEMNLDALWLLIGFIIVVFLLDVIIIGQKEAGVGIVIALMLPHVLIMCLTWTVLFAVWHLAGLPWGI